MSMNYNEHLNGNDTMNNYNQQLTDLNSCSSIYYNVDCNGAHYHNYYSDNVPFVTYNYDNTYSYDYKSVVPNTENTSQLIPKAATADNMLTPIYSKVESNMSGTGNYLNNSSPVFNKANKMTDTITTTSTTATFNSVIGEDKTVFEDKSIDSLEGTCMTPSDLDMKLMMKRERNRIAARKCRDKKLNKIKFYENRIDDLHNEIKVHENDIVKLNARKNELRLMLVNFCYNQFVTN